MDIIGSEKKHFEFSALLAHIGVTRDIEKNMVHVVEDA